MVQQFTYLGSVIENDGQFDTEIARRSEMALGVVGSLKRIWKDKKVTKFQKWELYHTLVLTVALCNAEVWTVEERHLKKLRSFERRALKTIAGWKPTGDDFEENESLEELRADLQVEAVEQLIREKRLLFAAHAARSAENSVCEQMDRECKEGTRWGKMLKRDLDDYGFQTLGNLADYEAKYARQSVWRKRKFYREEEDPQKEVYTPEEERHAQIRRESEAEFDESFLNNQVWQFTSRASLNFTTVFGKSYRVQKVEANDFHGQLIYSFMVKGLWYYRDGDVYRRK